MIKPISFVAASLCATVVLAQRYVPTEDPEFPRVQYADSTLSVNDRCIVRLRKLSPKIQAIYVNGRPIGFC